MKIAYCIPATYNSGGMERVLAVKVNLLVKRGYEVVIITTDQMGRKNYFDMDPTIRQYDLGINYEENNGGPIWKKVWQFPQKQRKHCKRLAELLTQLKVDITISMFGNDAEFITKLQDGSKKILEYHFSKLKRLQYGRKGLWRLADVWRTKADERLVRKFARFIVLTEEDKELWGELPNIGVIPNPKPFESEEVSELTQPIVVAAGRYDFQKNFEELLRIWAEVSPKFPHWRLRIFGNGADRESLTQLCRELGVSDTASLEYPTTNMAKVYSESSIYVMTSRYEGLPMVLIEAQTMGLPIVSYACPCGPRDIITDGEDGFLIPYGDRAQFVDRLTKLMNDQALVERMGQASRLASERFEPTHIVDEWETVFREVLKVR